MKGMVVPSLEKHGKHRMTHLPGVYDNIPRLQKCLFLIADVILLVLPWASPHPSPSLSFPHLYNKETK